MKDEGQAADREHERKIRLSRTRLYAPQAAASPRRSAFNENGGKQRAPTAPDRADGRGEGQ